MNQIIFPTLELFVYHLRDRLEASNNEANHKKFWGNLPVQENFIKKAWQAEANEEDTQYIKLLAITEPKEFGESNSKTFDKEIEGDSVSGYYYPVRLNDTYGLLMNCSVENKKDALSVDWFIKLKKELEFDKKDGNLGKTWILSGFLPENTVANKTVANKIAEQAYIKFTHESDMVGKIPTPKHYSFLNASVFEYWKSPQSWKDENSIKENIHVLIILYPYLATQNERETTLKNAKKFYRNWMELFCYFSKILFAYGQSRRLKRQLQDSYEKIMSISTNLYKDNLSYLQKVLQENIEKLSQYVVDINYLEILEQSVITNLENYQNSLKSLTKRANSDLNLEESCTQIVAAQYQLQIKRDHTILSPSLRVLENLINTVRGIVEIKQAQRDRVFQTTIQVAGVGFATAALVATCISPFVEKIRQPISTQLPNSTQVVPALSEKIRQPTSTQFPSSTPIVPVPSGWSNFWFTFYWSVGAGLIISLLVVVGIMLASWHSWLHPPGGRE